MLIRPTAFTIGLIIYSFITLFVVYTEFGIDSPKSFMFSGILIFFMFYEIQLFLPQQAVSLHRR